MQSSQDGVWKIYNAQLSSIIIKFQPNRMNGSSLYTSFFFASVLLFPLPGVPFPIANPALAFNILLKYCLLHETFPDSSARRAHFCLSNPWHLVQSYPAESRAFAAPKWSPGSFAGTTQTSRGPPAGVEADAGRGLLGNQQPRHEFPRTINNSGSETAAGAWVAPGGVR